MSRVDVLPALVSRISTMRTVMSGVMTSAPTYPDSFGAEISMFGIYRRWILAGSALNVWQHDLRSRIQELIRENEGEIYKKYKLRGATTCHCWMLGRNQHSAKPTIVIAHGESRILKRTMRVIDKHEILKKQGFELRGCPNCDLQLLTAASSAHMTQHINGGSSNLPISLCGAEVAVGYPPRYATLGGILAVAEELCAITVAHVFTEEVHVQTRNAVPDSNLVLYDMDWANSSSEDCSSVDDSSEGGRSDEDHTAEPSVSNIAEPGVSQSATLKEHVIQMGEFPLSRLSSESPFRNTNDNQYDDMDWALLVIPKPWYHCVNGASRTSTSWLRFEKIREEGPSGPVLIVSRKGIINGVGAGTASSIKLKGSINYRNIWSVQSDQPLDMGDSGSWVVDATTGDLYGVIVAASTVMEEGYLIPASEIMKDIQRAAGVTTVELPKGSAFNPTLQHLTELEDIDRRFEDALSRQRHGSNQEAEQIHRQLLLMRERILGQEHPDTLSSLESLASCLDRQCEYQEAEQIHRQLLASKERILGHEHPNTLSRRASLAWSLCHQGKYQEGEKMYRRLLALNERVLGREHPTTLSSIHGLAWSVCCQGRYNEAEDMYRRLLALQQRVLGKEHRGTVPIMRNLASLLINRGNYQEAEEMQRQALALSESVLRKENFDTLLCTEILASTLFSRGKLEESEAVYRQALAAREALQGQEHPGTLNNVYRLANLLRREKGYEDAEVFYQRAWARYRKNTWR